MNQVVRARFRSFNAGFEGDVPYMYLDIAGNVTIGVGNLIDPFDHAKGLPFQWRNKAGHAEPPSQQDIEEEWRRVKRTPGLASAGHTEAEKITKLELSKENIDKLFNAKMDSAETTLKLFFRDFENWPADAQLGLLSMAWAMGAARPQEFHDFSGACLSMDFDRAAAQCHMNERGNKGLTKRNLANSLCFRNADVVLKGEPLGDYHRSVLYHPLQIVKGLVITAGPDEE